MSRILLLYSTTDGHTRRIAEALRQQWAAEGLSVSVEHLPDFDAGQLASFDKIVIGASIRYGHHQPGVARFTAQHQTVLESRPSAFFSVNIVARKANKNTPETNPYLRKFLGSIAWKPALVDVFAGKLDYPRYRFFDRLMIRFIMLITHGPTDPKAVVEFTDWERVRAFGHRVLALTAAR